MDKRICPTCGKDCVIDFRGLHLTGAAKEAWEMEHYGSRSLFHLLIGIFICLLLIGVCLFATV